ncbi:MAG: radical SAM protein [Clostridiaceae bacterium]|nr:radical SAM protein [Clostridiaceae bacterium]
MKSLEKASYNAAFSHIYVEKEIIDHPNTIEILSRFPKAVKIEISRYNEIFSRSNQSFIIQKKSPALILAKKYGKFLFEGAPVCQDFGNEHFYYTTCVMNCIYDCEYCFLQGMYDSANIVVFVNLEDYFAEIEKLLAIHPMYLSISYDTDLLSLEQKLGFAQKWCRFTKAHSDLTIEIRTKSANNKAIEVLTPSKNIILAWTLSSETVQEAYEHKTPPLMQRLSCIKKALEKGFQVRICFDPILYSKDWLSSFEEMVEKTFTEIPATKIHDASIGVFRISRDYLKRMRKNRTDSVIVHYPYEYDNGVYHYGSHLSHLMTSSACDILKKYIPDEKIFVWN